LSNPQLDKANERETSLANLSRNKISEHDDETSVQDEAATFIQY